VRSFFWSFDTGLRWGRLSFVALTAFSATRFYQVHSRLYHATLCSLSLDMKRNQKGTATGDQDDKFDFDSGNLLGDLAVEAMSTTEATPPVLSTTREVENIRS